MGVRSVTSRMRIAIEGPPGVGKTTLCGQLAAQMNIPWVVEPVDENPYLADYYGDPRRWALGMQVHLLYRRAESAAGYQRDTSLLFDRSLWGDRIFAQTLLDIGLMERREFDTYELVFRALVGKSMLPDVLIYLRADLDAVWSRVQSRQREAENAMTREYLGEVLSGYEKFMTTPPTGVRVVTVDWSRFLPFDEVWSQIRQVVQHE